MTWPRHLASFEFESFCPFNPLSQSLPPYTPPTHSATQVVRRKREVYCTACKQSKAPLTNDAANDAANDVANDVGSDVANDVANNLDVLGTLQKDRDLRQVQSQSVLGIFKR